ncbi:MAG: protein kinase [Lentisphaeria bacterium]|nr:protein kinase [Lentisphaeria bacterium]
MSVEETSSGYDGEITVEDEKFFYDIIGRNPEDSKYMIKKVIASGGMGKLFLVIDKDFNRQIIMKVLKPEQKSDAMLIRTFVREARITGQLSHPNIVPVHDMGYHEKNGIYFTMKYVHGESLSEILYQLELGNPEYKKRFDFYSLITIMRRVCDAVAYAHSQNVIHRDIKPHNIMVGNFGEVYLMDWGLAKDLNDPMTIELSRTQLDGLIDEDRAVEEDGIILKGSPGYMSPEQAGRKNIPLDKRSDIFLIGATFYHLCTFFPPYVGSSVTNIVKSARKCDYIHPDQLNFGNLHIPEELSRIINKCMQKEKGDRYQNIEDLVEDLDNLIHGRMEAEHKTFLKGEYLLQEGEEGSECYFILQGKVEVYKNNGNEKVVLNVLEKGDIVGEMSLITNFPRTASVVALDDTEVTVMDSETFQKNILRLPQWMERTVTALAERLGEADSKLVSEISKLKDANK